MYGDDRYDVNIQNELFYIKRPDAGRRLTPEILLFCFYYYDFFIVADKARINWCIYEQCHNKYRSISSAKVGLGQKARFKDLESSTWPNATSSPPLV